MPCSSLLFCSARRPQGLCASCLAPLSLFLEVIAGNYWTENGTFQIEDEGPFCGFCAGWEWTWTWWSRSSTSAAASSPQSRWTWAPPSHTSLISASPLWKNRKFGLAFVSSKWVIHLSPTLSRLTVRYSIKNLNFIFIKSLCSTHPLPHQKKNPYTNECALRGLLARQAEKLVLCSCNIWVCTFLQKSTFL